MRTVIAFSTLLIAAACTTGNQVSQGAAHIPKPDITIIGRTDLTNVPTVASAIEAHFELRILNQADIPITLRRVDLESLGGGGIAIQSKNRQYDTVIQPHSAQSVDVMTTAVISDPNGFSGRSPVQIRMTALFDSAQGALQRVVQQQVRPEGSD
jgi:LEA14-like dessication related protein